MNKKGLTLVEMLLVVVLIAVIGLIVLPNISKMLNQADDKEVVGQAKLLRETLRMYVKDNEDTLNWSYDEKKNRILNISSVDMKSFYSTNPDFSSSCSITSLNVVGVPNDNINDNIYDTSYTYKYRVCINCSGIKACDPKSEI